MVDKTRQFAALGRKNLWMKKRRWALTLLEYAGGFAWLVMATFLAYTMVRTLKKRAPVHSDLNRKTRLCVLVASIKGDSSSARSATGEHPTLLEHLDFRGLLALSQSSESDSIRFDSIPFYSSSFINHQCIISLFLTILFEDLLSWNRARQRHDSSDRTRDSL